MPDIPHSASYRAINSAWSLRTLMTSFTCDAKAGCSRALRKTAKKVSNT